MGIQVNSLRVGNYVKLSKTSSVHVKLKSIQWTGTDYTFTFESQVADANWIEGIALTHEWFYYCGFMQLNNNDFVIPSLPHSVFRVKENAVGIIVNDIEVKSIYFLHELQNFVFVLCNEELYPE